MGRVIFSIFAGRKRFMNVLMSYVHVLVKDAVVDEVHVWDYCRVTADREYVHTLKGRPGVRVISPPASDLTARFPHKWKGYYAYYASSLSDDDLLIKCDDDVVFISNLHKLLGFARSDGGAHLLYVPSIVNNDVSASFQAADGVITAPEFTVELRASRPEGPYSRSPISDWYNCSKCADFIHSTFLAQPSAFFTGCVHTWTVPARVPINFLVMNGRRAREHFAAYTTEAFVDEAYLTAVLTERTRLPSALVSDTVVVHFAFAFQHVQAPREILDRYRRLSRDTKLLSQFGADFGARPLNQTCRATAPPAQQQGLRALPRPGRKHKGTT